MSTNSLEKRLDNLEKEIVGLKKTVAKASDVKDWRRTLGMFEGDAVMQEIDKLTLKVREDDRKMARLRQTKRKAAKS